MPIPDWKDPDWAYLLGVVHGDGHISKRSVSVSVSYKDQDYADVLISLFHRLGLSPKVYRPRSALRIDLHSVVIRNAFSKFKAHGKWSWPDDLRWGDYLAGVIDTDGCVTLNKSIIIILKRNGNLPRLAVEINKLGVRAVRARQTTATFNGAVYETETISITGMDRVEALCRGVCLRHPRKTKRLVDMLAQIKVIRERVPLWKEVGLWIQREGPKTWTEIAQQFGLTKPQIDSLLGNLKLLATVETIPPPMPLSRFRVSGL